MEIGPGVVIPEEAANLQRLVSGQGLDAGAVDGSLVMDGAQKYDPAIHGIGWERGATNTSVSENSLEVAMGLCTRPRIVGEWQPIETAPKDGTEFVVLDNAVRVVAIGHWMADVDWRNAGKIPGETLAEPGWFPLASPSHWMPLPDAPS